MTRNLSKNRCCHILLVGLLSVMSLACGCGKKDQAQQTPPQAPAPGQAVSNQIAKPVQKPVSSSLKNVSKSSSQFDFSAKKDPFKPFIVPKPQGVSSKGAVISRSGLPIHSYDLSQFRLIGVVMGGRESLAQVTDPTGKSYVIRYGSTIGKNEGKVVSIRNNAVEILEQFRDDQGKFRRERIVLTLRKKQ